MPFTGHARPNHAAASKTLKKHAGTGKMPGHQILEERDG